MEPNFSQFLTQQTTYLFIYLFIITEHKHAVLPVLTRQDKNSYVRAEVWLQALLTSRRVGGKCYTSRSGRFIQGKEILLFIVQETGWAERKSGLGEAGKRPLPRSEIELRPSSYSLAGGRLRTWRETTNSLTIHWKKFTAASFPVPAHIRMLSGWVPLPYVCSHSCCLS